MKKKSLLILPVLLLALAACNKEEEEEVPADDATTPTEPTEPGDQGGDGGEKEPVVDTRITLETESYILNPTEDADGNVTGVEYANPASGLSIDGGVLGADKSITYTLTGTAAKMTEEQAADFWSGYSAVGDKYIVISIDVKDGETLSWTGSDGTPRYEYASDDIVIRISGYGVSSDKLATGTTTYTITDADGVSVDHIVDFSALLSGITISTESISEGNKVALDKPFENPSDLVIASVETSKDSDKLVYTYTLEGTAGVMTAIQAQDFGGGAQEGSKYVILLISFGADETVSWGSTSKSISDYPDGELEMVLQIKDDGNTTVTYTITDSSNISVDHVVDLSALMSTTTGGQDA